MARLLDQINMRITVYSGYVALLSVIIVGAIGITMTIGILLFGIGSSRNSFAVEQSTQAWALTNMCVEEALQQIREVSLFAGSGVVSAGQGACEYSVTNQGGENRLLVATGTVETLTRHTELTISAISPQIIIDSWQELAR